MADGVVETELGKVAGKAREGHWSYRAIPFARPPLGELRFAGPRPAEPWSGVRDATRYSPIALQGAVFAPGVGAEGVQSEDCLYLNVYTPAADGARRPVMFFIHGGAFTVGSASARLYDGAKLAALHDVVVVTTNYRLGALGYLPIGELNRGSLDQLAALQWVQTNIARFGGDAANVTIFGESAGASSVCLLMAMPRARGLFARAIVQSASLALELPTVESLAPITQAFTLQDRTGSSSEELLQAQKAVEADWTKWPHFQPVASPLFGGQPRESFDAEQGSKVPLLIGYNRDEWNLFAAMDVPSWSKPLSDEELRAQTKVSADVVEVYRASRASRGLPNSNRALLRAILGDLRFRLPTLRFAERYRSLADTYFYQFTYASPGLRGELGACHALELPFVFGSYDTPGQDRFAGSGEHVERLSATMRDRWTTFARGEAPWARYGEARETMELDLEPRLVNDSYGEERAALSSEKAPAR
ncbi:MAG: carboxylesterase family protein [Polyangiales bacterium]